VRVVEKAGDPQESVALASIVIAENPKPLCQLSTTQTESTGTDDPKSNTTLSEFEVDLQTFVLKSEARLETGNEAFAVDAVMVAE
jgi:hypothetical protein